MEERAHSVYTERKNRARKRIEEERRKKKKKNERIRRELT
jgi:hypothetical protein